MECDVEERDGSAMLRCHLWVDDVNCRTTRAGLPDLSVDLVEMWIGVVCVGMSLALRATRCTTYLPDLQVTDVSRWGGIKAVQIYFETEAKAYAFSVACFTPTHIEQNHIQRNHSVDECNNF